MLPRNRPAMAPVKEPLKLTVRSVLLSKSNSKIASVVAGSCGQPLMKPAT